MSKVTLRLLSIMVSTALFPATAAGLWERYEVEYYSNVSLPCNYTLHSAGYPGLLVPFKRYWILPNSSMVLDTFIGSDRSYLDRPSPYDFNLVILNVDDDDFGVYHCVMLWNNIDYAITAIPIGLNEHGPRYKKKLKEFERNVLIGGFVAGGVFLVLLVVCIVCLYKQRKWNEERSFKDLTYHSSDDFSTKLGYGGETRKHTTDPESTTRPPPENSVGRTDEADTEVYAQVDRSRLSSRKSVPNNNDVITEQSVHL